MRRLLLAALGLAVLAGCAPDHGTVVDKRFTPAHDGTWLWCHPVGKVTVCQPMPKHYDDEWELNLRLGDDEGWVDVDHATYERTQIGDSYGGAS